MITNILAVMTKMSILSSWQMGVTFIPISCLKGIISVPKFANCETGKCYIICYVTTKITARNNDIVNVKTVLSWTQGNAHATFIEDLFFRFLQYGNPTYPILFM